MKFKSRLIGGTFWTSLSTLVSALVQISTLAILSRFLDKTDFGLVAIVTIIYGLIQTFTNLGFSVAVMHKKNLSINEFSSLFWIQLFVYIVIYFICYIFTPNISNFYEEQLLLSILPIFLVSLFFLGIGQLYGTLLLKEMLFKTIAVRNITSQIVAFVTAIVLAILNFGVYSYILSLLIQIAVVNLWNFFNGYKHLKIKLYLSINQVKPLIRIGLYQTGTSALDYLASSIDVFIIGKWLGMEDLGIYNLAKDLVKKVVSLFTTIANKVVVPFFSEMQDKKDEMANYYIKIIKLISLLNFPICVFLGAFSYFVVHLMYGSQNLEVAPILSIFALWGMVVSVGNPVGNVIVATGRTDLSFLYTICRIVIILPMTIVFARQGNLILMALCAFIGEFIICYISCKIELTLTIGLSIKRFYFAFIKEFSSSTIFIIIIYGLLLMYNSDYYLNIWKSLTIVIPIFSIYLILTIFLNKRSIIDLKALLLKKNTL